MTTMMMETEQQHIQLLAVFVGKDDSTSGLNIQLFIIVCAHGTNS